jgi:HEAT repeat protein
MTAIWLMLLVALAGAPPHRGPETDQVQPSSASAPALSDDEVAERVDAYLGTIDTPITADEWRALGPRAVDRLASIAVDTDSLSTRRAKAVGALSVLGGARARQVVRDTVRSEDAPFAVRASAIRGLAQLLGPQALAKELQPVLHGARETPIRATAAEVLAGHAGTTGCSAVKTQVAREPPQARAQFSRALKKCGLPPP